MDSSLQEQREQAHLLLNAVPDEKIPKIRTLLASMVDPLAIAIANAPLDEEPLSTEEERELVEARAALAQGVGIPHEEILKDFGLTPEDWDRMGETPIDPATPSARV